MKYINQLTDNEILEMAKGYAWGDFKELISISRGDNYVEVILISECEDDEDGYEGQMLTLEDMLTFSDFDFKAWDYQASNKTELTREYRKKFLSRFGNQYALDFLLK